MTILSDLISRIKTPNLVEQMRIITETVLEEESSDMEYIDYRPQGPNLFLALQVPGRTPTQIGFLALERENEDSWLVSFWTTKESDIKKAIESETKPSLKKRKMHEITDHRPEKILTEYAKLMKFYHGE